MNHQRLFLLLLTVFVALSHGSEDYREEDASEEMEYGTILRIIPAPAPTKPIQTSAFRSYTNNSSAKSAKSSVPLTTGTSVKSSVPLSSGKSAKSSVPVKGAVSKSAKSSSSVKGAVSKSAKSSASVKGAVSKSAKSSVSSTAAQGAYSLSSEAQGAKKGSDGGKDGKKESGGAGPSDSGTSNTGKGPGKGVDSTEGSSNYTGGSIVSVLTMPSFMLTMTRDTTRRRLGTYLDFSITESVLDYLGGASGKFESLIGASIQEMSLDIPSGTKEKVDGDTATLTSVFEGSATFTGDNMVTRDKIIAALTSVFEKDKKLFLQHAAESNNPKFNSIKDVQFSLVGGSDGSGYSSNLDDDNVNVEVKTLKSKSSIPMIAGMAAGISVLVAAFVYTKKRQRDRVGYELSNDFDNDLESPKKLKLSDLAAGSTQNVSGYASLITGVWNARKYSMSELAAGATQEDFAQNGMHVDIYGKSSKDKKRRKVSPRANARGAELITTLDSIQEARSLSGSETWHDGLEEINKAPPLLPALSVTTSTGSDDDENSSFGTPRLLDMTGYSNTSGIEASPHLVRSSPDTPIRRLNYSGGSFTDDEILNAMDPDPSDSSSDGCVKNMLRDIDDCEPEKCVAEETDIEVVPLGFEESAEDDIMAYDDNEQTEVKNSDHPVKSVPSTEPSMIMEDNSSSEPKSSEDMEDTSQEVFESGEVIHNVIFGSDTSLGERENQVSEPLSVSDDDESEHSSTSSFLVSPSSMSVDGDLTEILISGADEVSQ